MAPHLVRAWGAYKDMRIHLLHHTHTHKNTHTHTQTTTTSITDDGLVQ